MLLSYKIAMGILQIQFLPITSARILIMESHYLIRAFSLKIFQYNLALSQTIP